MQITRETPDQLILEYQDWLAPVALSIIALVPAFYSLRWTWHGDISIAAVLAAIAVVLLGLAALSLDRSQLIFDRQSDQMTHRRKTALQFDELKVPLAAVETYTLDIAASETGKPEYQPSLLIKSDEGYFFRPLISRPGTSSAHIETANRVNDWLEAAKVDSGPQSA